MKRLLGVVALVWLVAASAGANFCAQDVVPAATLLFPYIEVSMTPAGVPDPEGQTTITHVTNVGREAIVVHFTVWDLAGIPRFTFDEILSGYDALQINWRDVINGRSNLFDTSRTDFTASLPLTFDPQEWGPDGRYQTGGLTTPETRSVVTAGQCPGPPPYANRPDLAPLIVNLLHGSQVARQEITCNGHQPQPVRSVFAWSLDTSRLFFYATADVVANCTTLFPSDPPYWSGVASPANVLTGQVIYLNAKAKMSEMMPAVHIEASTEPLGVAVPGFYDERTGGVKTRREPLGTAFAFPYQNDQTVQTNLIFWKNFTELDRLDDPMAGHWGDSSDCGSYVYYAWDMDERSMSADRVPPYGVLPSPPRYDPNQLSFATQKVPVMTNYFDLPASTGWMLVVLPPSYGADFVDPTSEGAGYLQRPYMGWAAVQFTYGGYSAGSQATTMANTHCFPDQTLPHLGAGATPAGVSQLPARRAFRSGR